MGRKMLTTILTRKAISQKYIKTSKCWVCGDRKHAHWEENEDSDIEVDDNGDERGSGELDGDSAVASKCGRSKTQPSGFSGRHAKSKTKPSSLKRVADMQAEISQHIVASNKKAKTAAISSSSSGKDTSTGSTKKHRDRCSKPPESGGKKPTVVAGGCSKAQVSTKAQSEALSRAIRAFKLKEKSVEELQVEIEGIYSNSVSQIALQLVQEVLKSDARLLWTLSAASSLYETSTASIAPLSSNC